MTLPKPLGFVFRSLPTLLVLAVAGTLGYWGHSTEWKLPKFSALTGHTEEKDDWCEKHGVPESICVECDADLLPKPESRGWCKTHGIAECALCNPELAQLAKAPDVTAADLERAKRSLEFAPRLANDPKCKVHERRIQFATARDANKAGIDPKEAERGHAEESVSAPGELGYDPTRIAYLTSRSPGTVWKVYKHPGHEVAAGELLALIDAPDIGRAKAEVLQSTATLQLKAQALATLKESGAAIPAMRLREAEVAVREAEIHLSAGCQALTNAGLTLDESEVRTLTSDDLKAKLHFLGIPNSAGLSLGAKTATTNLFPLIAPKGGLIVSRDVIAGEVADTQRTLFEIVERGALRLSFDLKAEDAARIEVGQKVFFKPDHKPDELAGTVSWRSSQVDPKTRAVKVRADLIKPDGKQLANTFGAGRILLREVDDAVLVPNDAVHWEGCCHIVFVRDKDYQKEGSPKVYHVRKVRIGAKGAEMTEIAAGVLVGEVVAAKGSGALLAVLQSDNLGEGCACHAKK